MSSKKARTTSSEEPAEQEVVVEELQRFEREYAAVKRYLLNFRYYVEQEEQEEGGGGTAAMMSASNQQQQQQQQHPPSAVLAAIEGLDKDLQRRRRDYKLRTKFGTGGGTSAATAAGGEEEEEPVSIEKTDVDLMMMTTADEKRSDPNVVDDAMLADDDEDWQDVQQQQQGPSSSASAAAAHQQQQEQDDLATTTAASSALSRRVIALLGEFPSDVRVRTPAGAVAAALHAALAALEFKCTGLAAATGEGGGSGSGGGFAAPIRELPPNQFLPARWETKDGVELRYRKNSITGSVYLRVTSTKDKSDDGDNDDDVVEICLYNNGSAKKSTEEEARRHPLLEIRLGDYVNLESFRRALASSSSSGAGIAPALHYKSLSHLLSRFAATFDLGGAGSSGDGVANVLPYVDTTAVLVPNNLNPVLRNTNVPLHPTTGGDAPLDPDRPGRDFDRRDGQPRDIPPPRDETKPPLIHEEFPFRRGGGPHGDFADDLLPAGIPPYLGGNGGVPGGGTSGGGGGGGGGGGSLMGPNHPIFQGGGVGVGPGISGVGPNSGFGMRPRFDPFGPPGGPTEIDNSNRPGGPGDPNRDDEQMPNAFHDNNTRTRGGGRGGGPRPPGSGGLGPAGSHNNNMFM